MNIDHLKNIKKIVAHGPDCPDGRASALIVHEVLPDAEIEFVNYNTARHISMTPEPGVIFVDFSPWAEREKPTLENKSPPLTEVGKARIQEWAAAGTIVLDHHKGADDIVAMFGDHGVFADEKLEPGISGASLAWREVFSPLMYARALARKKIKKLTGPEKTLFDKATLISMRAGIRDTWQTKDAGWGESCDQAAALVFWPWEKLLEVGVAGLEPLLEIGPVLRERDYARDTKAIAESYRFTYKGIRVMCFEGTYTSDIAERVTDTDLIVGWHYLWEEDGLKMRFSCRSRGDFSALGFAKAYGGGGHVNAAGFTVAVKPANQASMLVPFACVELLVGKYLGLEFDETLVVSTSELVSPSPA